MSPSAITPPAVEVKSRQNPKVPKAIIPVDFSSIRTKWMIICFSGTRMQFFDPFCTLYIRVFQILTTFLGFDGTIFMQDTGHILFNNFGYGSEQRKFLDEQIHSGERSFRDVSEEMWGSLDVPFDDGFAVMKDVLDIDPESQTFHKFCLNKIPFNVISAGLKPVLRRVLDHFLARRPLRISKLSPTIPLFHQMVLSGSQPGSTTLSSATTRLNPSMTTENMPNSKAIMGPSL